MASNKLQLFLPAGRIVMGNVYKPNPLGMDGKPKDKPEYFFGLAVAKNHPECPPLLNAIWNYAMDATALYPHIQQRVKLGLGGGFAWKIGDGDVPDSEGKLHDERRGCHIFKLKTTWPIRCVDRNEQDIVPETLRTGFWADGAFNISFNGKLDHTAGIHLNPVFVRHLWNDKEIVMGPKASEVFKDRAAPPPPAGAQGGMPGAGGMGGQQYQQNAGGMPGAGAGNPSHSAPMTPSNGMPGSGAGGMPNPAPSSPAMNASHSNQPAPSLSAMPMGNGGSPATAGQMPGTTSPGMNTESPAPSAMGAAPTGQSDNRAAMAAEVERLVAERLAMGNAGAGMTGGGGIRHGGDAPATAAGSEMGNGSPAGGQAVPGGASAAPGAGSIDPAQASPTASHFNPHPQFVHGGQA